MEYLQYFNLEDIENLLPHVLNLVINGIPSILQKGAQLTAPNTGFKPCYKWNTFNTENDFLIYLLEIGFKPCYKWNTFNTVKDLRKAGEMAGVLNLVINGIPSIPKVEYDDKLVYKVF